MMKRLGKTWLPWLGLWFVSLGSAWADPAHPHVPPAENLAADARVAADLGVPIVLVVTRDGCEYCELLKSAVVVPMIISGEYEDRALIREIMIDGDREVVDFEGRTVSPFSVADNYDALLAPTVLVVGPDGGEVAKRLIGINNVDMYLWYLDQALDQGQVAIADRQ